MDDYKLQEEPLSAYDLTDQRREGDLFDELGANEVVVENVNPLNEINFRLSSEDQERLTDEAKSELKENAITEINRILVEAKRLSKGSEKTLQNNIKDAVAKGSSKARSNSSAVGFALIGGVVSQAIGTAINLDTGTNAKYSIIVIVFVALLGGMLAFRK